jgi:hypothetical protein
MDDPAKGGFTTLNGFRDLGDGVVEFLGTAIAASAAIRGLVFEPADGRVRLGQTETTRFTILLNDQIAPGVTDSYTTVVATADDGISRIVNQFTTVGTSTGPIIFEIGGFQVNSPGFAITGTSSNPSLVPNANISFGGSGTNRTFTLTPANNLTGIATIKISVTDGSRKANTSFTLGVGQPTEFDCCQTVANTEGGLSGTLTGWLRMQEVYASICLTGIVAITEVASSR